MKAFERLLLTAGGTLLGAAIGGSIGKDEEEKRLNAIKGAWAGAGITFGASFLLEEEKDTVNYILKNEGERVYDGIAYSDRLERRIAEHESSGKEFDEIISDDPKPRVIALELERKRIVRFKPKYNVHHNSK